MDNIHFYNSFRFRLITLNRARHTDNSGGIDCHFVARMRRGSAVIVAETGETLSLCAGEIFYIPLGLRYQSYWTPDGGREPKVEWESYGFDFFPCKSGKLYALQKLNPSETALAYLDRLPLSEGVSTSSIGLLYAFLGETFPTMKRSDPNPQRELLSKARHYIYQHPQFKVEELARHCGMSESGLYAFFRSYAHTTPIEEKNRIQTQKAITLLGSTDLPVEEIANRMGFQSIAYFRKIVKAQTGKTPTELRREQTQDYQL